MFLHLRPLGGCSPRHLCIRWGFQVLFRQGRQDNTSDLVDLIHPIGGVLEHQLAGLHGGRHRSGDQSAASVLRRFLAASLRLHADELLSSPPRWDSLRSCDLGAQRPDTATRAMGSGGVFSPGGSSLAPCMTRRPSPAAPGASTPAGDTERILVRTRVRLLRCPAVLELAWFELLPTLRACRRND